MNVDSHPSGPEPAGFVSPVHNRVMNSENITNIELERKCDHGYFIHVSWHARCPWCPDIVHAKHFGRWPEA